MSILVLVFFCGFGVLFVFDSIRFKITPTPTASKVACEVIQMIPKAYKGSILDCGSGFGTLLFKVHSAYPNLQISGYEAALIPYLISKMLAAFFSKKQTQIFYGNFLNKDLKKYDLLICYLYPSVSDQLVTKFKKELKKGTFVISHTFALRGLNCLEIRYAKDLYKTPIYLYQI